MPHDRFGATLSIGDEVMLRARVVGLSASESACNASFNVLDPDGFDEHRPDISCNARLCEKIDAVPLVLPEVECASVEVAPQLSPDVVGAPQEPPGGASVG